MSPRIASAMACLLAATVPSRVVGFAPSSSTATSLRTASSCSSSFSPTSSLQMSSTHASEDMYPQLLSSASLCAHSESCSIEDAELYLNEIVHVQSGCAAGTMSGNTVCKDVLDVSEVVADLRQKIGEGAKHEVRTFWGKRQEELEILAAASDASAPLKPAYLAIAALSTVAVISAFQPATMDASAGVVPFSPQEVWWAIQDGYLGDMTHHLFRNGGLLVSDAAGTVGSSLSPQELLWSIRDGYAGDTFLANGGGGVESVPFTPQEILWSVQNGYANDMVAHWFRNGGLSV